MQKDSHISKKRGPKSGYADALGTTKRIGLPFPAAVVELLKERSTKRLLSWMVMDPAFKAKVLSITPANEPVGDIPNTHQTKPEVQEGPKK
jgi:hypothetical protein